jgi:hypothetical protein
MLQLGIITKYMKPIIGSILAIVILYVMYKIYSKAKDAGNTIGDVLVKTAEDKAISSNTGVTTMRVGELRGIANDLGIEMETMRGTGWYDEATHVTTIWTLKKLMAKIKTPSEVSIVESIYKNEVTDTDKTLKQDIIDYRKWMMFTGDLNSIQNFSLLK